MYLSKYLDQPEEQKQPEEAPRSTLGEMGAGLKRGLFTAVPEMIGGAIKAASDVDSDWYKRGQGLQDDAKAIAGLPDIKRSATADKGIVNSTLVAGAEGVGQMLPILGLSAINPIAGAAGAAALYGGSTYQDTKERALKQEGLDDRFAQDNPDDPRVMKAKSIAGGAGVVQGLGEAAMTAVGGKFVRATLPNLGKSTAEAVLNRSAAPAIAGMKQFGKGAALNIAGETITEPIQDEGQAAIERAGGLQDAPAFGAQALDSAKGGFGTALLLAPFGIPAHAAKYGREKSVQIALTDPTVDPQARQTAAQLVAADLAAVDPAAAANFLTHASDAIGDVDATGTAPYGLNLEDTGLLQPFQVPATPDTSQGETGLAAGGGAPSGSAPIATPPLVAREGSVGAAQFKPPFSNFPGDIPDFSSGYTIPPPTPTGPLGKALSTGGIATAAPVAPIAPVAPMQIAGAAQPQIGMNDYIDAEYEQVNTPNLPPGSPAPQRIGYTPEMELANRWADEEIRQGGIGATAVMGLRQADKTGQALVVEWKRRTQPATTPLDAQAHDAASSPANDLPEPTKAQIAAGNYKKGHIRLHGLDISIENPAGSIRKGVDPSGKSWETQLAHHYGYIKGTVGKDKDHIDVFIKPGIDQTTAGGKFFVVDQIDPKTGKLDEHKVMAGFDSAEEARQAYLSNYDQSGPSRIGAITESSADNFKQWLKNGNTKKQFASQVSIANSVASQKTQNLRSNADPTKDNLITAIAKMGGVSEAEVRNIAGSSLMDARHQMKAGIRHSITSNGQPLDTVRQTLVEQGYLSEGSTVPDLIDAMSVSAQGKPVYSSQRQIDGEEMLRQYEAEQAAAMEGAGIAPDDFPWDMTGIRDKEKHRKFLQRSLASAKTEKARARVQTALDKVESRRTPAAKVAAAVDAIDPAGMDAVGVELSVYNALKNNDDFKSLVQIEAERRGMTAPRDLEALEDHLTASLTNVVLRKAGLPDIGTDTADRGMSGKDVANAVAAAAGESKAQPSIGNLPDPQQQYLDSVSQHFKEKFKDATFDIDDDAQRTAVQEGNYAVDRIPQEAERAALKGKLGAAASIAGRSGGTGIADAGKGKTEGAVAHQVKLNQAEALKKWAADNGLLIDPAEFNRQWKRKEIQGAEHDVYFTNDGRVIKRYTPTFTTWSDYFNRVALHNFLFPDTAYTLSGFMLDKGKLYAVVEQPFIKESKDKPVTDQEIYKDTEGMGFSRRVSKGMTEAEGAKGQDFFHADGILMTDLHDANVFRTYAGSLAYIDVIIWMDPATKYQRLAERYGIGQELDIEVEAETTRPPRQKEVHRKFLQRALASAKTDKARKRVQDAIDKVEAREKGKGTVIDQQVAAMSLDDMAALFDQVTGADKPVPVRDMAKARKHEEYLRKKLAQAKHPNDKKKYRDTLQRYQQKLEERKQNPPALSELPTKPEKDEQEKPFFKRGDRIQTPDGKHGEVIRTTTMVGTLIGIDRQGLYQDGKRYSHHYEVKWDDGVEGFGSFSYLNYETDPAPAAVLAPKYNGTYIEPDQLLKNAEYKRKSARDARDAAGRARKADTITSYKKAAEGYDREADAMQAAFDAWATENPEAAATYRAESKPAPATAAAVSADAVPGLKVTYNSQHNGIELRFDGRPADDVMSMIKAAGFKWSGRQKLWYAPKTEARQRVADELAGTVPTDLTNNQKLTIRDLGPIGTRVQFKTGSKKRTYVITDIEPEVGKVAVDSEKIYRYASEFERAENAPKTEARQRVADELSAPVPDRSASDIIKAAAASGVKGADEALKGLHELFGGSSLKSFPGAIDEGTYAKAKPHFVEAFKNFREAGKGLQEFFRFVAQQFGAAIKPYLMRFMEDVKNNDLTIQNGGTIEATEQEEVTSDDNTRDGGTGTGTYQGGKPGALQAAEEERGTGQGDGSIGATDAYGNENPDEGGNVGTGSVGSKPSPVRVQTGEGDERTAGLLSEPVADLPGEPRTLKLKGDNPGNYRITAADNLGAGTPGQKIANNLAAIRLVKQLEADGRYPTREEQAVLAKYVGWGGLKSVFDPNSKKPQEQKARQELEQLLTKHEYFEARQSVLNAHYTSPEIIGSIYKVVQHMGFNGGHVLEPTYGSGNFIGLMPEGVAASSKWYGSELDPITSRIGKYLYPDAQLIESGFQAAEFPYGKFDLAIGNPPFGSETITDTNKKRSEIDGFKIHNYVIAKSGMHLRPGGVMAMVVTSRFLDTDNPEARDYLAQHFKFLTAIRLPNDAFAKNAGTEVTTDLVFFQKLMPGTNEGKTQHWLRNRYEITNELGEDVTLNAWFAKHPELMLGIPSMKGTMYGGQWRQDESKGEFTLNARPGQDTAAEIEKLLASDDFIRLKDVFTPTTAQAEAAATSIQMNREDIGIGGYVRENGKLFMREDDDANGNPVFVELTVDTPWTEKQTLGETRLARINGMMDLRELAYKLIEAERFDLPGMEELRTRLNSNYDAFVKKYGFLSDPVNASLMADDVKIESGLEVGYRKAISAAKAKSMGGKPAPAKADKAAILTQRVYFPVKEITSAANARDGYNISLSERGRLDLDYIAGLLKKERSEVIEELAEEGLIFRDPETGEYIQEDAYLSGNVKAKLRKVQGREGYEKNAEALEKILPKDVATEEIFTDLGATWIPAKVYEEFAELMGVRNPQVVVIPETGTVRVVGGSVTQNDMNVMLQNPDHDVVSLINHIAQKKAVVAYDRTSDDKLVVNKERTKALVPMVKRVSATFRDWIMADPLRARELTKLYNDTMNTHAPRVYNGNQLKTVGASPAVRLRNSQRNAAWRMIQSPVVLLDHVVGAGKTFTVITGVMERKRLGLSNKSMIVVPNHLVGQWAADFLKLYPGARILAAGKKDFEKKNRRRLFARIATGNFDAIIVGHSSFGFIPMEPDTVKGFIEEEISYLERALTQAEESKDRRLIRNIAERIAKKRERIARLLNGTRDDVVTFENMGIDNLVVDESHEFKNLEYSTAMQNITGMGSPQGAKKSFDLYSKIQYLRQQDGSITFATGTPISNSLVEMYTILRYLNREGLKERNLDVFDAWAMTYASVESRIEYTASQKLKDRQVMATFNNLPEMLQLYNEFADVISMKELKRIYAEQIKESNQRTGANEREEFPVPNVKNGGRYLDIADPTSSQREYMDYLVARANRLEKLGSKNDPREDNHLWLMNDARKMALDIRLVDPSAAPDPNNKINRAANNIKRIYDAWDKDKGTQLVFCDLSTPAGTSKSAAATFIKNASAVLGLEKDKNLARVLSDLTYFEQWTYLKNRLEREIEKLNNGPETDANEAAREKIEKFLEAVADDDVAALNTADTGFSVYDDLKAVLIGKGIPANEIKFIHEANTDPQKQELFGMVNAGQVRVLIGSSRKMGAGTNAQERLVALHHMDAPWRPSDVEQREGRIIRQGNMLYERDPEGFEIEIPAYSTRNTFDAVMWQVLARKAEMLEDFRSGARSMQDAESDSASYAEFMAESTGNPIFREKFKLEREIEELESTERNIMARRSAGERLVKNADKDIARAEKGLQNAKRDLDEITEDAKFTVDGKQYADDLTDAYNAALHEYNAAFKEYETKLLPEYVAAKEAVESLPDDEKKAALKALKKPVQPVKPTLQRLEKTSEAARAALRVSELLDDIAERGEVEFAFGGAQIVIKKVVSGKDQFDFTTYINGQSYWRLSADNLKHMSQQKLMDIFRTGEIHSRVAQQVFAAQRYLDDVHNSIKDAKQTLSKLVFADKDKLTAMQERYKAVVEEVNALEKQLDEKREKESNRYIDGDRIRFGSSDTQYSLSPQPGIVKGMKAEALRKEFAANPLKSKIVVVQTIEELPDGKKAGDRAASREKGAIEGMYHNGTIYLVADSLPDVERARIVALRHELTHAGQGRKITGIAEQWFREAMKRGETGTDFQQDAVKILQVEAFKRGYKLSDNADFTKAVQEATAVLAEAMQPGQRNGLFNRLIMYLRHYLRKIGVSIRFTDKELVDTVAEMMRQGERNLMDGRGPEGGKRSVAEAQHEKEYAEVEARYFNPDGTEKPGAMLAPNGERSNLNKRQWVQVRTPSFKKWFGDWESDPDSASKVVDANGEPLVVYHGTDADFTEFEGDQQHFFTESKVYAENYKDNGVELIEAYLSLQKPFPVDMETKNQGRYYTMPEMLEVLNGIDKNVAEDVRKYDDWDNEREFEPWEILADVWFKNILKARGYDGYTSYEDGNSVFAIFSPTQIKSAIGNTGAFDSDNPDIRYSLRSPQDAAREKQLADHLQKMNPGDKTAALTRSFFDLIDSALPPKLKANIGKILSNPWFGSEGNIIRRAIVNLNLVRSHVRNAMIHDLMVKSDGYTGTEGLDNILKTASPEEVKAWNSLIKKGDIEGKAYTTKELKDDGYSQKVIDAYHAFHEVIATANRVRFDKLKEIALLPYKNEPWFKELTGLLEFRHDLDRDLNNHQIGLLNKLLISVKALDPAVLKGKDNPTGKPVDQPVIDAYMKFRKQLEATTEPGLVRMAYRHITEYNGKIDEIRNEWGHVRGYAPRLRKDGDWHVSVYRIDEADGAKTRTKVFMQPVIAEILAQRLSGKISADMKGYLKGNFDAAATYEVEYARNTATPAELMNDKGRDLAIESLLDNAFEKAEIFKSKDVDVAAMKRAVLEELTQEIMAQGFSRHGISREPHLIEGYQDEDYQTVLKEFISGQSGWLSKIQYAVEVTREADSISKSSPDDKVWIQSYYKDSMKNANYLDEVAATARSIGAVWYLGFKASSAVINSFQNYTVGQAELSRLMKLAGKKGEAVFLLAKAQKDVLKDTMTAEEKNVLDQAIRQGTLHAQAIRAMSGLQEQGYGGKWKKFAETAMTPFSWVEQHVNREPAFLAAYRVFKTTPADQFDQTAFDKAEEFVNSTHYVMGNENLPELVRMIGPLGKTLYLFQGYVHNYLLWLAKRGRNGEFAAIARSFGAIAALGGLFALPGADDMDKWIEKWFGVSYKQQFKQFTKRNLRQYGTPGDLLEGFINNGLPSVFGVNMSRAVAVNIPFVSDTDKSFGERIGGVWGGIAKKPGMALSAAGSGEYLRALENLAPEFIANPMRAYRQYTDGATTLRGKPVFDETGRQMKYSGLDVAKKALGFQPLEISDRTELKGHERGLQAFWKDERDDVLAKDRKARTSEERREASLAIMRFNKNLKESQAAGLVPPITLESIRRSRTYKPDKKKLAWEQQRTV